MALERPRIVVGLSPHQSHDAALELAAVEARARGGDVHLVVVEHQVWTRAASVGSAEAVDDRWRASHLDLVQQAEKRVRTWLPAEATVSTEIAHGTVARSLCDAVGPDGLLVVQHHRLGRRFHAPTLSITNAVASHAPCPVVAVPDSWRESAPPRYDVVVAAIESATVSWSVADAAFLEAERLGASVRLVHTWTWSDDQGHEDPTLPTTSHGERTAALEQRLREQLSGLVERYAEVPSEVVVICGHAPAALVVQSEKARRLVIGRHDPESRFGSHLGPVTRTVLTYGHCPIVVV